MSDKSKIQWTDATWNPIRGCSRISPGCGGPGKQGGCYAEKIAARFSGPGEAFEGYAHRVNGEARWTGKMGLIPRKLDEPLRWREPRRIFVNSMSDLFHENLADDVIATVYAIGVAAVHLRGHTLQILTKRADRMRRLLATDAFWDQVNTEAGMHVMDGVDPLDRRSDDARATLQDYGPDKPAPGIWLGVSVEDQERADERIPHLLQTPAAKRFISAEPLLGGIDLTQIDDGSAHREIPRKEWGSVDDEESPPGLWWDATTGKRTIMHGGATGDWSRTDASLDWVIVGGESGGRPRASWTPDIRAIVRQCQKAGVAVFVKQLGANVQDRDDAGFDGCEPTEWPDINPSDVEHNINGYLEEYQGAPCRIRLRDRKGGNMAEWPEDLRVREFPAPKSP